MIEIDKIIENGLEKKLFSGITVEVGDLNKVIYNRSCGLIDKNGTKVITGDTIFDMASVTKTFTSTVILYLISEGRIELQTRINDIFQEFTPYLKGYFEEITVKDLLNHGSGIHYWYPFYTSKDNEFIKILENILIENNAKKPGTYSDLNFILLGKIIEKITDKSLEKAISDIILSPLDMDDTTYNPELEENIAATEYGNKVEMGMVSKLGMSFNGFRGTKNAIFGDVNDGNAYYYFNGVSGHAGIFSTIHDMRKIPRLYLNGGKYNEIQLIDTQLIEKSKLNYGHDRGLGWALKGIFLDGYGHTGFTGTSIFVDDSLGIYIIILTNRLNVENPMNINDFRMKIHQEVVKKFKEEK